jgi:hypothetical protein
MDFRRVPRRQIGATHGFTLPGAGTRITRDSEVETIRFEQSGTMVFDGECTFREHLDDDIQKAMNEA